MAASDLDGVAGEVVFPTTAVRMVETNIASDLLSACCRAVNDWMADFSGAHPKRLKGTCLLNVDNIDEAVAELERCLGKGTAAACVPAYPGEGAYLRSAPLRPAVGRGPRTPAYPSSCTPARTVRVPG